MVAQIPTSPNRHPSPDSKDYQSGTSTRLMGNNEEKEDERDGSDCRHLQEIHEYLVWPLEFHFLVGRHFIMSNLTVANFCTCFIAREQLEWGTRFVQAEGLAQMSQSSLCSFNALCASRFLPLAAITPTSSRSDSAMETSSPAAFNSSDRVSPVGQSMKVFLSMEP